MRTNRFTIAILISLLSPACHRDTFREEAAKYYKRLHNDPVVEQCKGLSILKRGNQFIVFVNSTQAVILEENKFKPADKSITPKLEARLLAVTNFMQQQKIAKIQANFNDKSQVEFRMTEDIILVKSSDANYCQVHIQQNTVCEQLANEWYYYIGKNDD